MGMWIEMGIFVLVLAFGIWQIHDVGQERRKREERQSREAPAVPPDGESRTEPE